MSRRGKILLAILIASIIISVVAIIYVAISFKDYILIAVLASAYFISYPSCFCYLYDFIKSLARGMRAENSYSYIKIFDFVVFFTLLIPMVASLLYFRDYMHNRIDNKNEEYLYDTYN